MPSIWEVGIAVYRALDQERSLHSFVVLRTHNFYKTIQPSVHAGEQRHGPDQMELCLSSDVSACALATTPGLNERRSGLDPCRWDGGLSQGLLESPGNARDRRPLSPTARIAPSIRSHDCVLRLKSRPGNLIFLPPRMLVDKQPCCRLVPNFGLRGGSASTTCPLVQPGAARAHHFVETVTAKVVSRPAHFSMLRTAP